MHACILMHMYADNETDKTDERDGEREKERKKRCVCARKGRTAPLIIICI